MKWLGGYCFYDCREKFKVNSHYLLGGSWIDVKFKWNSQPGLKKGYEDLSIRGVCKSASLI
jgi:hypothetical protein